VRVPKPHLRFQSLLSLAFGGKGASPHHPVSSSQGKKRNVRLVSITKER